MTILSNAAVLVSPPAPPARPYGLFDAAVGPLSLPRIEAEVGGIQYQPDACGFVHLWASECDPVTGKVFDEGVDTVTADPFIVYASWLCGSIGYTPEEIRARLLVRMNLKEQSGVEARLWQGDAGNGIDGLFADAISLGTAGCPAEGVRMLEQALADNGVQGGIIHARSGMAAYLGRDHQLIPEVTPKVTNYGTALSLGQGYDGSGPAGQAPTSTSEWMYATGRVVIWAGDLLDYPIREVLDRTTNQQYAILERPYMVAVECGIWAVNVTRECVTA